MIMEEYNDKNFETEDDRPIKIFEKLDYVKEKMGSDDIYPYTDNSNMKMFIKSYRYLERWGSLETGNAPVNGELLTPSSAVIPG